jgi:hypothetical protein
MAGGFPDSLLVLGVVHTAPVGTGESVAGVRAPFVLMSSNT